MNNRDAIIDIINKIPGIRYKELQRVTNMPNGTLSYHIYMLEKEGLIKVKRDPKSTRLLPIIIDDYTSEVLSLLRDEIRLKIVKYLLKHGSATYMELYSIANRSFSTLTWHLNKLIDANIIVVSNNTGMKEYSLRDRDRLEKIVKNYFDAVDNFIDTWSQL